MNNEDVKTVRLVLNSEQAQKKLEDINKDLVTARQNRINAFEKGDADAIKLCTREVKRLERQQAKLQTRAQSVTEVLEHMDQATPDKLNKVIREINRELNSGAVERGSKEWNSLTESLKAAKAELNKIHKETEANEMSFTDRLKNFGDYWVGFAATAYTAIQGLAGVKDMMRSSVQEYAAMQEHMAGVIKYTGMTTEQVDELNEAFMRMDTRTAREQLNDLAGDAGRLGIQAKQDVLDFVEAADQINVALGEDLGEDAVKNIGKLAQLFGDSEKMGLKKAMLSTGSVINELAQSSSASESYLMEFTARLAGVGHQAGMSQAQVMAFGSVLDQSMVNVEKGATALQNVITGLYTKPAELARIAGLDVKKFTDLLKKDGNAAVLQFIQALHKGGGLDKLAPALEAMKLSGAGVTQVLAALATNVDALRSTQEQATRAFEQGTSVTKEFNTANSTVQAQLDKAKARFHDVSVQLGKELMPVTSHMIGMTSSTMKLLVALLPWLKQHYKQIIALSAVIATYTIAINMATIKTKAAAAAQVLWNGVTAVGKTIMQAVTVAGLKMQLAYLTVTKQTEKAAVAQRKLNAIMLKNPYALVAAAVVALCTGLYLWITRTKELTEAQKAQQKIAKDTADIQKAAADAEAQAISRTRLLTSIIHDNSRSLDDRRGAIEALKKIVPDYTADIDDEGRITRENTTALNDYVTALKKSAMARALLSKTDELTGSLLTLEDTKKNNMNEASLRKQKLGDFISKNPGMRDFVYDLLGKNTDNYVAWLNPSATQREAIRLVKSFKEAQKWVTKQEEEIKSVNNRIKSLSETAKGLGVTIDQVVKDVVESDEKDDKNTGGGFDLSGDDALKKKTEAIKTRAEQQRIIKQVEYDKGLISHRQYTKALSEIDVKMYEDIKAIYDKNSAEYVEAEKKRLETLSRFRKEQHAWSIEDLDRQYAENRQKVKDNYLQGLMDEKKYHKQLTDANLDYLKKKAAYYRQWGMSQEAEAAETAYEQASQEEQMKRQQDFWKQVDQFKKEFNKKSSEEQMQFDLNFANELHKKGLLSEEEYQKAIKAIRDKYQGKDSDQYQWNGGSPTDPLSQGVISLFESLNSLEEKLNEGKATWQDWASVGVASLGMVSAIAGSVSQLIQANLAVEEKKINERYDGEIKKAGRNKKKSKQLEEARQKELAKVKTKYAKKAMAMQITQAIASTAQNAIMAYGSVLIPGVPWTYPLAAIAAGAALASGMLQVAAIKKQAKAQSEGYYVGGFTHGREYRREAGVVHEGEFVANHYAVNNPNLLPVFNLLDYAQRNNTVGSLTPTDVSRTLSASMMAAAGNEGMTQIIDASSLRTAEVMDKLDKKLDEPIKAYVVISGPDGLDEQTKKYRKLNDL